jgi:hypothetical protein
MADVLSYPRQEIIAQRYREEALLHKANEDIEAGRSRLRDQEHLILTLKASGRPTVEAERFVALLRGTLTEWEIHRGLIAQRLAYLMARLDEAPRQA